MPPQINITRAKGQPSVSPAVDFAMCIIGCATSDPLPLLVSPPYGSPSAFATAYGIGDGVDAGTQAITKTLAGNPAPPAIAFYRTPATTPGGRGATLDTSGIDGTAVVTKTASTHPVGTYQPVGEVLDDGNDGDGGLIGTDGIVVRLSPDNGRHWLPSQALGTAFTLKMQIGGVDTGVQYDFAPSTTNAAYVALAVELRSDVLAHLANNTAHDGADTSAAQIALNASSVPATVSASTAVVNLVLAALLSHVVNITSVHDGPDLVAYTALAALSAATDAKTGIDLAIAIKSIYGTHIGVALTASTAGLQGATASIASPTTYTAASDYLAGGVAAMNAQPRRVKITISGGGTPANMADSVTITGFDYAGNAQTETALSLTGLGTVISTKAFKGTGLALAFVAADGTAASFQTGYSNGVHNSADSTNTISSADPTYGTLKTGDTWSESKTTPPQWDIADIYSAGPPATGALAVIAASSYNFGLIAITEPVEAADFATLSAGLDAMTAVNAAKRPTLIIRFRDPEDGESDADYVTAFRAWRAAAGNDERIVCVVGSGWLTDAFRSFVYLRSGLPAVLARIQSMQAVAGALQERVAQSPGYGGRGPLEGFSIVDSNGNPVGHNERVLGGIDSVGQTGGGLTFYYEAHDAQPGTYVSRASTCYPADSKVFTLMDNRVSSGIERALYGVGLAFLQGADVFDPGTHELDEDIVRAIEGRACKAIKDLYAHEIQNAEDPNLVQVNPVITVDQERVTMQWYVNDRLFGYTDIINIEIENDR